jgi:hypothetical protein
MSRLLNGQANEIDLNLKANSICKEVCGFLTAFNKTASAKRPDVRQFKHSLANTLEFQGAEPNHFKAVGISKDIRLQARRAHSNSLTSLVLNAPARRPIFGAYTHDARLRREVENICDEFSAVNPSKQMSVIARLSSKAMTPEGRANRKQVQELRVTKSVLFQTFKLRFALSDFGSISATTFNRFVPNWIREGKSRICLCVACDQFTGSWSRLFIV